MEAEYMFMPQKVMIEDSSWLLLGDLYMPVIKPVAI